MPTVQTAARTDAGLASELRLSVMRLRRRLSNERHPDNPLSMGAMAVLGCLFRKGDLTVGELAACERIQPPSMTRIVNALEDGGYVARRDAWLARRLRELTSDERAVLRRAAPLLERLAAAD
jgi:DNA-binding MarR family transcriptional regulator